MPAVRRSWRGLAMVIGAATLAAACQSAASPVSQSVEATVQFVEADPTSTAVEPTSTVLPPTPSPQPTSAPTVKAEPTPAPTAAPAERSTAELVARSSVASARCPDPVRADRVSCYVASMPLDPTAPDDGAVELMVAVVDNGDPNDVGPVVFLQGGPGVGSVTLAPNFVGAAHDVVFVDQRGTGFSTPKLACAEVDDLWVPQFSDDSEVRGRASDAAVEAAYAKCHDRLSADGIDLAHFNTSAAAADMAVLRQLLGYDEWSIWGISYGTRLGLTIMRDHPDGVRAAVLDSVVPFEVDFFATIPENALRAMTALDDACDASACANNHGEFFENLSSLVLRLDADPIVVTATRPGSGENFPVLVDGEQLLSMVFTQLYSTRSLRSLPRQVARADFGGIEQIVANFVSRRDPSRLDLSIGMYYSTWCREEFPFYDPSIDDALLIEAQEFFGDAFAEALSSDGVDRFCAIFEVAESNRVDDEPITSDIPALVFAGAFDPITPPSWSRQVAESLSQSTFVELADHGHGMATSCPTGLRLAFLQDPARELDTTCADETTGPAFD